MNKLAQVFIVIIVIAAFNAFAQEQAPKPTYQEGDFWQYKVSEKDFTTRSTTTALNGTYELRYIQGKVKAFLLNGPDQQEVNVGPDTTGEYLLLLLGGTDERQSLNFPLNVGKKWNYSFRRKPPGARNYDNYHVAVNVIGVEQVATTAGTFKAFRLEDTLGFSTKSRQRSFSQTYFYSPETKSVIKVNLLRDDGGTQAAELIKFGLADKN
jgi:hypothetical protein